MKSILAYLSLVRVGNCLFTFVATIVGAEIAIKGVVQFPKVWIAALTAALVCAFGNVINDFFDYEIDKINRPSRPLPSNKISLQSAKIFSFILLSSSLLISINYLGVIPSLIVAAASLILFFYSAYFKKIPLVGNAAVSFLTGFLFLFAAVVAGNYKAGIVPFLFAFITNMIREIIKDMEDKQGDKENGLRTFPIVYGFNKSKLLIHIYSVTIPIAAVYLFLIEYYKIEFFILVMVVINSILLWINKSIRIDDSTGNLNRLSTITKFIMIIGLTAIYLGT